MIIVVAVAPMLTTVSSTDSALRSHAKVVAASLGVCAVCIALAYIIKAIWIGASPSDGTTVSLGAWDIHYFMPALAISVVVVSVLVAAAWFAGERCVDFVRRLWQRRHATSGVAEYRAVSRRVASPQPTTKNTVDDDNIADIIAAVREGRTTAS